MKELFIWLIVISILLTNHHTPRIQATTKECLISLKFTQDKTYYTFNDIMQDPMETAPVNKWSRLFLVIRYVTQNVPDTTIRWIPQNPSKTLEEGKKGIVIIETNYTKPPRRIEFFIGYHQYKLNGQWLPVEEGKPDVTPFIVNGRTLIPLRRTAESLDAKDTLWEQSSHTATLLFTVKNCDNEMELIRIITFKNPRPFQKECSSLKPKNLSFSSMNSLYKQVIVDDCHYMGEPGEPVLASKTIETEIPLGWEVESVSYTPFKQEVLPDSYTIESGQVPYNEFLTQWEETLPKNAIYGINEVFPVHLLTNSTIREQNNRSYLLSSLTPLQFNPVEKKVTFFSEIQISIRLKKATGLLPFNASNQFSSLPSGSYRMVIVSKSNLIGKLTDSGVDNNFAKFAQWKTSLGVTTNTYDMDTIQKTYPGNTIQEKIKNFIRDAKTTWGIQYVLLGGDVDSVPSQTILSKVDATKPITQATFPSDTYYACLGQNEWLDVNKDQYVDDYNKNMDLMADVYVGRVSVRNQEEIQHFFDKQRKREKDPYHTSAFLFGGLLSRNQKAPCNETKYAWGECYLESLLYDVPLLSMMNLTRKYQIDGSLNKDTLIKDMNKANPDIVLPQFHGQWDALGALTTSCQQNSTEGILFIEQLDELRNTVPFFWVTGIPCMTNCFDEIKDFAWSEEEFTTYNNPESMSEKLFRMKNYGAYAYIGNAHYGWFDPYSISNSASYQAEKEFLNRFIKPNAILGKAFHESKEVFIPKMAKESDYRWIYHSLNLLGDPSFGDHGEQAKSFSTTQESEPIEDMANGETSTINYTIENLDSGLLKQNQTNRNTSYTITSGTNVLQITPDQFDLPGGKKQDFHVTIKMSEFTTPGTMVPFSFRIENDLGEEEEIQFEIRCKDTNAPENCCYFSVSPDWKNLPFMPEGKQKEWVSLEFLVSNTCQDSTRTIGFGFRPASEMSIYPTEFSLKPKASQLVTVKIFIDTNAVPGEISLYSFYYSTDCGDRNILVSIPVRCVKPEIPADCCTFIITRKVLPTDVTELKPGNSHIFQYTAFNTCKAGMKEIKFTLVAKEPSLTNPTFDPSFFTLKPGESTTFKMKVIMPLDAEKDMDIRYLFEIKTDCGKTDIQTFAIKCIQSGSSPACCTFTISKNARPSVISELKPGESYSYEYTLFNICDTESKEISFTMTPILPGVSNPVIQPSSFILKSGEQQLVKVNFTMPPEAIPGTDTRFIFEIKTNCGKTDQQYFTVKCAKEPSIPGCCDWVFRIIPGMRVQRILLCPGDSTLISYYEVINNCPAGSASLRFELRWPNDGKIVQVSPQSFTLQPQTKQTLSITIKMPIDTQAGVTVNFPFTISCRECGDKETIITAVCKDCWCKASSFILKINRVDSSNGWLDGIQIGSNEITRIYFDKNDSRWKNVTRGKCYEICYETRKNSLGGEIKWGLDFRLVNCT